MAKKVNLSDKYNNNVEKNFIGFAKVYLMFGKQKL